MMRAVAVVVVLTVGLAGCSSDDDGGGGAATASATATLAATATPSPTATATSPDTPSPTATASATQMPSATATETSAPSVTPTPSATETPTSTPTSGPLAAEYPAQECASAKQAAAAGHCEAIFQAWASWETTAADAARAAAIDAAAAALDTAWDAAEQSALSAGVDCADLAVEAGVVAGSANAAVASIAGSVNDGLDLNEDDEAGCGAALLAAAGRRCAAVLAAESRRLRNLSGDPDGAISSAERDAAEARFAADWSATIAAGCPTTTSAAATSTAIDALAAEVVHDTIVAPGVSSTQFTTVSPTGTIQYLGKALTPICMDGSPYHFFVRRGSVNKLVMYYQGGGACWEGLTCSVPTCDANVNPAGGDNPNGASSGFADRGNPDNPFRDWHAVFVSYCGCDVHYGDAAQDYPIGDDTIHVEHRGFHNAQVAEKWAREHFVDPEVVFVTGSSAGAYGAWFHAVPLQKAWPASRFHVLADAGNGVITQAFLDGPFGNWNFEGNLPDDVPGIRASLDDGTGIPGYTEAVTAFFPRTNWAHYTTAFDGGSGGQTGFYNIMLNDNNPIAALSWWEASCAFNAAMRAQAIATAEAVPSNYRYYIGTGSRHTMWGNNKVYGDTTGGVPTIVDWVQAMLATTRETPDPAWTNVECENCGLTLPGDPRPAPLVAPFEQIGDDVVIVCEPE